MKKLLGAVLVSLLLSPLAMAQEGYPLKGSWIGEWQGNEELGEFVLLVMDWDGEKASGVINPGTDDLVIDRIELDPDDWSVSIEAGDYEIEGAIQNLELPSRAIIGTWKQGRKSGHFEISRQ